MIAEGIHILLPYTQHLQYICISFNKFAFKALSLTPLRAMKITFIENRESCTNITILATIVVRV